MFSSACNGRAITKSGLEVLLASSGGPLAGRRVGLITNPTGVHSNLTSTVDLLHHHPQVYLVALFGPEHGVRGEVQDGISVPSTTDPATGLPVYSLYGETRRPTSAMLEGLEALVFDLQDVGVRFYTYLSTLVLAMEAAAERGLPFVVLDRPNPITGVRVEGPLLDLRFRSFIGYLPIPLRHGLTLGELAGWCNRFGGIAADLTVVPLQGWSRAMWFDQTGWPWIPPSPNMPTLETAIVYPGTCLFEGTNLSEGRGTTRPFEWLGAPWLDGAAWAAAFNARNLPGVRCRPIHFIPTFSKYAGERCGGVQVHVCDRDRFEAVRTGLHLLETARAQAPDRFAWRASHFDRLMGTDRVRQALDAGQPVDELVAEWTAEQRGWMEEAKSCWLYR